MEQMDWMIIPLFDSPLFMSKRLRLWGWRILALGFGLGVTACTFRGNVSTPIQPSIRLSSTRTTHTLNLDLNHAMDYATAIGQLQYPQQWCQAAAALAKLGDPQALVPLLRAYQQPTETSKICLLDAMDALNAIQESAQLYDKGNAEDQVLALYLMGLFPAEEHLARLEQALFAPDTALHQKALQSLRLQYQTPAWENLLIRLLKTDDAIIRQMATEELEKKRSSNAR
jgi:hypothetical protein